MASNYFRGDAQAVSQVTTITVGGTPGAGQVYTVTMNRKTVTYTALGGDDNDEIATALQEELDASTIEEFAEVDWTVSGSVITGTASTAGRPYTHTSGATGTGTLVTASVTSSAGPSHWDTASNWSLNAVPVSTNDVYIGNSDVDILYGIDQNSVTLASLNIDSTYTGKIGLPDVNEDGDYREYRETYLKISATLVNIGSGDGGGSSRIRLNLGTAQATIRVERLGSPESTGRPAMELLGTHASNTLHATHGDIGIAYNPGEVATVVTTRVGFIGSEESDVKLYVGSGATMTTVNQNGGEIVTSAGFTTVNMKRGTLTLLDAAAVTTLANQGGYVHWRSTGTLGTTTLGSGAALDASRDLRARTATTLTMLAGSTLLDPYKTIVFTNPFTVSNCTLRDVEIDLGSNFSLQRS